MDINESISAYLNNEITFEEIEKNIDDVKNYLSPKYEECVKNGKIINYNDKNDFSFHINSIIKAKDILYKKASFYEMIYNVMNKSGLYLLSPNNKYEVIYAFALEFIPDYLLSDETSYIIQKQIYPLIQNVKTKKDNRKIVKIYAENYFILKIINILIGFKNQIGL